MAAAVRRLLPLLPAIGLLTSTAAGQDRALERLEGLQARLQESAAWQGEYEQEYIPAGMTMGEDPVGAHGLVTDPPANAPASEDLTRTNPPPGRLVASLTDAHLHARDRGFFGKNPRLEIGQIPPPCLTFLGRDFDVGRSR